MRQRSRWRALQASIEVWRKLGLALCIAGALATVDTASAKGPSPGTVALTDLPAQAQATEQLIRAGGPFPYAKDGAVFGNRERVLPKRPRGEYREYTVPTPGTRDRGARRIVCGGRQPNAQEAC